jgi:Na+/H+ antiporter NhaD/arsenite permease-like protein
MTSFRNRTGIRRALAGAAVTACILGAPWLAGAARAAEAGAEIDGRALGLVWVVPFAGLLLSIALLPLVLPHFWHRHHGKVAAGWALLYLAPSAALQGIPATLHGVGHTLFQEYLPFVILLLSLFTVAGGVRLVGQLSGTPRSNTALLALGTLLASIAGTTGTAVLLIRPLIAANEARRHKVHVFVFFIFLVGNIGGALSPLGDPPLFLGFLQGVSFFWPTSHLLAPMLVLSGALLAIFFVLDSVLHRREPPSAPKPPSRKRLRLEGKRNLVLLLGVLGAVLMSGLWNSGVEFHVLGATLELENVLRDLILLAITAISLKVTRATIHEANGFSWFPILEVAKLFAGLFLTIIPAIAILHAGKDGALAPWIGLLSGADGKPVDAMYFWMTGVLSSFLDNAPTYLMFFNAAGGDAKVLMGPLASTLLAISAGAVFMGANTYVGNAPNFMVKSICEERGIRMPSFFGYMAWSVAILMPLYVLLTWLFFRF